MGAWKCNFSAFIDNYYNYVDRTTRIIQCFGLLDRECKFIYQKIVNTDGNHKIIFLMKYTMKIEIVQFHMHVKMQTQTKSN